ncbi:MAG: helix-turn-helix domain-containing protein [Rhodoferax sp.]|nr:helix-turn-helix domain-containing protein [Rhodoferax sp.]
MEVTYINFDMVKSVLSSTLVGPDRWVAVAIASHANGSGDCSPSVSRIAYVAGLSDRAVQKHIAVLVDLGLIERNSLPGRPTRYTLILENLPTFGGQSYPQPANEVHPIGSKSYSQPTHAVHHTPAPEAPDPRTTCAKPTNDVHPNKERINKEIKKGINARESESLANAGSPKTGLSKTDWALRLVSKHEAGEPVSMGVLRMARSALTREAHCAP